MVPLVGKFALLIPHFIRDRYENKDIFSRHLRYRSDSGPTPPWVHSHQQTHKKIKPQTGLYFFMVPLVGIGPTTPSLPRMCATTTLQRLREVLYNTLKNQSQAI